MKTITLSPKYGTNAVTNTINDTLVISNVSTYRVGNKLIWIEYNNGDSIVAVKRNDYANMTVSEITEVVLHGEGFERINCEQYGNF